MFKYIIITLFSLLVLPSLALAQSAISPKIIVISPNSADKIIVAPKMAPVKLEYSFNKNQGIFDVDLCRDNCLGAKVWSIAKGKYVSLSNKSRSQDGTFHYNSSFTLDRKPLKETGEYYLRICYSVKNQGLKQIITCASSTSFIIEVNKTAAKKTSAINVSQLANLWQIISSLLAK